MRITQRSIATTSLAGLNRNLESIARIQQQMSSGRTITKPSDNPSGANASMLTRSDTARNDQYAQNVSDGKGWLQTTDSTLTSIGNLARNARDLAVQAANAGAASPATRTANSLGVTELYNSILGLTNTSILGRPIFGGTTSGSVAYDATGTFVGRPVTSAEPEGITRQISDAEDVRIDVTGVDAFGDPASGSDLLGIIKKIAADILDPTADVSADLTALDAALTRMSAAHSTIGARMQRVDNAQSLITDRTVTLKNQLGEIENTDIAKATMELALQNTGYETALAAAAKSIQPTLLDYLR